MLVRAYRLSDKLGLVILKLSAAFGNLSEHQLVRGVHAIAEAVRRSKARAKGASSGSSATPAAGDS